MLSFLCVYLFFACVFSYEVTTKANGHENIDVTNLPMDGTSTMKSNETKPNSNNTIATERITRPSQTQKVERTLESILPSNGSTKIDSKSGNLENFKPSPQLETYYEFNKFPVAPALPEAKTFGSFGNPGFMLNSWGAKPSTTSWSNDQGIRNTWYEHSDRPNSWDPHSKNNQNPATEQPWITRVKFPSPTVTENPYNFVSNNEKFTFPTTTESFSFNKPVETPNRKFNKPSPGLWQKLMGSVDNSANKNAVAVQKTFSDYNLMEKPPHYETPLKEFEKGVSSHGSVNPWTKIIKLLTAIIPIGLFISALTPTVITVSAMNETQSRYRVADPKQQEIASRLASSLKYAEQFKSCEDKILCELLVTASVSKNSDEHIKNLLDTFTEHEDLQTKKEDLLKVFEAVKKEDCNSILCKSIKSPS